MKRYDNIQIFRVAACLGVFVTHLAPRMGITGQAAAIANFGASGVYLFFIISGFLACADPKIRAGGSGKEILSYYMKRLLRILPLYYAVILYNMALHILILRDVPQDPAGLYWLRYFLLTNAFLPAPDNFWANLGATWTISLFAVFYLLAPFLVRLAGIGKKETGLLRTGLLYLAALLLRYAWVGAGLSSYMMIFYYLHFFVLGMLVWQLAQAGEKGQSGLMSALFMAVLSGMLWCTFRFSGAGNDYFIVLSWIFAVVMLLTKDFSWKKEESQKTGRIQRAFQVLDQYSYAVYLVHAAVIDGIGLLQAHVDLPAAGVLVIAVFLTAAGAYLAHLLIEKPVKKWGRRLVETLLM